MKKLYVLVSIVAIFGFAGFARPCKMVALVVQDHAEERCEKVPILSLTDTLTAALTGCGLEVINPYNSVGVNQNRDVRGEKTPDVSAMELARKFNANGAITATVYELLDNTIRTTAGRDAHFLSIRIVINLADAWTGAAVVPGAKIEVKSANYNAVSQNRQKHLNDLIYAAADECAARLKKNPEFCQWLKSGNKPSGGLFAQMKADPEIRKWIESMIDGKVSKAEARTGKRLTEVEKQVKKLSEGERPQRFEEIVSDLTDRMLLDENFVKDCKADKEKLGRLPILVIGTITNKTGNVEFRAGLESSGVRLRERLRNLGLFDVRNEEFDIVDEIEKTRREGTQDGKPVDNLGKHSSNDYVIYITFDCIPDLDGSKQYEYRIELCGLNDTLAHWIGIKGIKIRKGAK